jgi:hypothetical protein
VASALILPFLLSAVLAQGDAKPATKADTKAADSSAPKDAKPRAKPRGRLPAYYNKVVDGQQREKIYAIQQQYEPKINALKAELQALQDKMNAEVEGVLTPAQLEIVKKANDEAKQKRQAAGAAARATTPSRPPPAARAANNASLARAFSIGHTDVPVFAIPQLASRKFRPRRP